MKLKLPRYTSKDYVVLGVIIMPFTAMMNAVIFRADYYGSFLFFMSATLITGVAFSLYFVLCGGVAVLLKKRFPDEYQLGKRLGFMIVIILLMTGLFLLLLFSGYEKLKFTGYAFERSRFLWTYVGMGIINIFLIFLHEGIAGFERWKENQRETEELRQSYRQGQLLALKSQVNPHFLFNSLNSLSSLINEDEERAEKFLDEMTRVYRYMLRNDDEHIVPVSTELAFLKSYMHLLQERFGEGLQLLVQVKKEHQNLFIPPLTLQVIVENAFSLNTINKSSPLVIRIQSTDTGLLLVSHNIQPKKVSAALDFETGLDNVVLKYRLLNQPPVLIEDCIEGRCIKLPLIRGKVEEAA